jgi:hypothetical protein
MCSLALECLGVVGRSQGHSQPRRMKTNAGIAGFVVFCMCGRCVGISLPSVEAACTMGLGKMDID